MLTISRKFNSLWDVIYFYVELFIVLPDLNLNLSTQYLSSMYLIFFNFNFNYFIIIIIERIYIRNKLLNNNNTTTLVRSLKGFAK